jgi:enoyl-CoA hydratase/carnithine racemase
MVLTCREITADTAENWGLVTRTCPEGELQAAALALAIEVAQGAPLSLRASRTVLRVSEYNLKSADVQRRIDTMLDSHDALEGAQAFKEKRAPN